MPKLPAKIDRVAIDADMRIRSELRWQPLEAWGKFVVDLMEACNDGNVRKVLTTPFVRSAQVNGRSMKGRLLSRTISLAVRRLVLSVGKCTICGSTERLTVDHIVPFCRGGNHDLKNLQCLCWPCNLKKGPTGRSWGRA